MRKKLKIKISGSRTRARELFLPGKYQRIHNEAEEELPKTLTKLISPDFLRYITLFLLILFPHCHFDFSDAMNSF